MFPPSLIKEYPEVTNFLTSAILKGKLANSYIFIGKDHNNILSIAISLAKILNCTQNKETYSSSCGACLNCRWLEKKEHPQALIIIAPDSKTKSKKEQIKIDTIRELLSTLQTSSEYFRVIFFPNSNYLTLPPDSCNLLLKPVEETPARTVFIFANTTKNDILPTILSRSHLIYLNKEYKHLHELNDSKNLIKEEHADCSCTNTKDALEKAGKTLEYLEKTETGLKDYLTSLAFTNYESHRLSNPKNYCTLYENLSKAYLKYKSFMQPRIVLEDMFLNLIKTT